MSIFVGDDTIYPASSLHNASAINNAEVGIRPLLRNFVAALRGAGFRRTEHPNQINPETVTITAGAGGETNGYFDLSYLDDGLHDSNPIFLKTGFYFGSGTSYIRSLEVWFRLGLTVNEDGTMPNSVVARSAASSNNQFTNIIFEARGRFYGTHGTGFGGVYSDISNSSVSSHFTFLLHRTPYGAHFYARQPFATGVGVRSVCSRQIWVVSANQDYTFIPSQVTSSHKPAEYLNVYRHLSAEGPQGDPLQPYVSPHAVTVHSSEISLGDVFAAAPDGGTPTKFVRTSLPTFGDGRLAMPWGG